MNTWEAAACVSDENGNLLFYTDGTTVWNVNGNIMPNGDSITGVLHNDWNHRITNSSMQGALIVPVPSYPYLYYIFSIIQSEATLHRGKLFYSVVNMSLNGGLGDVDVSQKGIFLDSQLYEGMTGIRGEDNNVWVVVHSNQGATFKVFEVGCSGVNHNPVLSTVGTAVTTTRLTSPIVASPDRRRIALANFSDSGGTGNLELYDFNPQNGVVSGAVSLSPWLTPLPLDTLTFYSCVFSPNSKVLYAHGTDHSGGRTIRTMLCQYDLTKTSVDDITRSRVLIDSCATSIMRLGPDGCIYLFKDEYNAIRQLERVRYPDSLGLACTYQSDLMLIAYSVGGFGTEVPIPYDPNPEPDTVNTYKKLLVCFSDTITLSGRPGTTYLWNTGSVSRYVTVDTGGIYWVLTSNNCGVYIDTFEVVTSSGPEIEMYARCTDQDSVMVIARYSFPQTINYTFQWTDNEDNVLRSSITAHADTFYGLSGSYLLYITPLVSGLDTVECMLNLPFTIDPVLPYATSFTIDTLLCQHQTYTIQNTSTGYLDTWYWNFGDGTTSNQQNPQHRFALPGRYRITLVGSNPIPCYDTFQKEVIVDSLGLVHFTTNKTELCSGDNIELTPSFTGNLTSVYWNLGDSNSFENIYAALQHAYDQAGVYPVTLTGKFRACPDTSFTDTVNIHALPLVYLGGDTAICLNGSSVILQNLEYNQGKHQYLWSTGSNSERIEVTHPGIYSLTLTSPYNCNNTETIEVKRDCYADIPNAFTPNGDGVNDYFFPRLLLTQGIAGFRMQIFNRWGVKVFETVGTDGRGWDGKMQGKEQPGGTYIYIIDAVFNNNRQERYKGNVTLIR